MTNLLTRRLALFRIASAGTVAAVAAAPVALAAIQPKHPESAELIRLGDELIGKAKEFESLETIRLAAKVECDRLWPKVPEALYVNRNIGDWLESEREEDCDRKSLFRIHGDQTVPWPRQYHTATALREKLKDLPKRGGSDWEK